MRRTRGGDKLRARMYNDKQGAYIAGHVTDHDNGSYSAKLPATWPGPQTISVFLAYTREAVRAIYYTRKQVHYTCMCCGMKIQNDIANDIFISNNIGQCH